MKTVEQIKNLPQLSQDELIEKGQQAVDFKESKEHQYVKSFIDSKENELLQEKLALRKDDIEKLHDICVKIDFLSDLYTQINKDIFLGKQAKSRQEKEFTNNAKFKKAK